MQYLNTIEKMDECYHKLAVIDEIIQHGGATPIIQRIRNDYFSQLMNHIQYIGAYLRTTQIVLHKKNISAMQVTKHKIDVIEQIFNQGGYNDIINFIYMKLYNEIA